MKLDIEYTHGCTPKYIEFPGGSLQCNQEITLLGTVSQCGSAFSINFKQLPTDTSDISLHFNPRMGESTVVRNTYVNGGWQHEERCTPFFPFTNGADFNIRIEVNDCGYNFYVNDQYYLTYNHRPEVDYREMRFLYLSQGAEYHKVLFR